jgi:hypothetical protein
MLRANLGTRATCSSALSQQGRNKLRKSSIRTLARQTIFEPGSSRIYNRLISAQLRLDIESVFLEWKDDNH